MAGLAFGLSHRQVSRLDPLPEVRTIVYNVDYDSKVLVNHDCDHIING